jgi:uncharacterized protein Usg
MVSQDFCHQLQGYGLTTARIFYRRPDHPWLLQTYVWQQYDVWPEFPVLQKFLAFWRKNLEGPLHSVTVAHSRLIQPAEIRAVAGEFRLH